MTQQKIVIDDLTIPVERDKYGRISYHPELHHNHGKPMTEEDLEYMCKYYEIDGIDTIGLALGRTGKTIRNKVMYLRKIGRYEFYKNRNKYW